MARKRYRPILATALCFGCLSVTPMAWSQTPAADGGPTLAPVPASPSLADAPHPRSIALRGQANFRDLGGYRTQGGQTLKWGQLYRSGELSDLDDDDYRVIRGLGIRTVYDLRTDEERAGAPTSWRAGKVEMLLSPKIGSPLRGTGFQGGAPPTPDQARDMMLAFYRAMPDRYAPEFSAIFHQLLEGKTPLLLHCTAGKDRSGLASALILSALGVPRAAVIADYRLSDQFVTLAAISKTTADGAQLSRLPPETAKMLLAADPAYLNAAFQKIEDEYGSVDNYLRKSLSIDNKEIMKLKKLYVK